MNVSTTKTSSGHTRLALTFSQQVQERMYDTGIERSTGTSRDEEDEAELKKLRAQYGWLQITKMKLLMDLIFVCAFVSPQIDGTPLLTPRLAYDVFKFQRAKDSVKTYSGLASALLRYIYSFESNIGVQSHSLDSTWKTYDRHRSELDKTTV